MTRSADWWHRWFLGLARYVATASKDPSTQVGAVIVGPQRQVIAVGYNGFPRGMVDAEELLENRDQKNVRMIHAEVNALMFAGGRVPEGSTLYTYPLLPCPRCAVLMIQAGFKHFVAPDAGPDLFHRWNLGETLEFITRTGGTVYCPKF